MMRIFYLFIVFMFLCLLSACYRPGPKETLHDLHQLSGNWLSKQVRFHEIWRTETDTLLTGLGYSLQGQDTVFKEQLKFFYSSGNVYYAVKLKDENDYTLFKLVDAKRSHWVFENKTNDYPNIITYEVSNDELITATTNNQGKRKIEFKLQRTP